MTYDVNPSDISDSFEPAAPEQVRWPSHPIAQQLSRGLPWLKMYMQSQTKPRKIIETMSLLKCLATEIYKVELAFIAQIMVYLLRRDAHWQIRVKHELGGDKAMRKWWRRFERVQSGELAQTRELSEHQRNMSHDYTRSVSRGPITDYDGLFRLAPITGCHKDANEPSFRPYRVTKPTPVFQPIHITPADLGVENPAIKPSGEATGPSFTPFHETIRILTQTGRRLDAYLFQDWLAHLHDNLMVYLRLGGRATVRPDTLPLE